MKNFHEHFFNERDFNFKINNTINSRPCHYENKLVIFLSVYYLPNGKGKVVGEAEKEQEFHYFLILTRRARIRYKILIFPKKNPQKYHFVLKIRR